MIYEAGQYCYSLQDDEIKKHFIMAIKFLPMMQLLRIDGKWQCADIFFPTLEKAMDAEEGHRYMRLK